MPGVVESKARYARRVSSLDSIPSALKRFVIVGTLSSAARIPLPGVTNLAIVARSSVGIFNSLSAGIRSVVRVFFRRYYAQKQSGPKGRLASKLFERSAARFAVAVNRDRRTGWRAQLHAMLYAAEVVSYIPIVGPRLTLDILAALNILSIGTSATTHVGTDGRTRDRAARGGDVTPTSAANLVTQHAAYDRAGYRARNVGAAAIIIDLLALDPAALLGRTHDRMDRSHRYLEEPLAGTLAIVIARRGQRLRRLVIISRRAVERAPRGN